ncbi:MAG: thioredoxin [Solobacterium sp.]|nr:thioredoxin [Solobacterium sp.]
MNERTRKLISVSVFLIGALMAAAGVMRGEAQAVYTKAIHLCMQCIGIG